MAAVVSVEGKRVALPDEVVNAGDRAIRAVLAANGWPEIESAHVQVVGGAGTQPPHRRFRELTYEARARRIAREVRHARSAATLKRALLKGLEFHAQNERGYHGFVRIHARAIYKLVLTRREKVELRREMLATPVHLKTVTELEKELAEFAKEEKAEMGELMEMAEQILIAEHPDDLHMRTLSCASCYSELIENVLYERSNPRHAPRRRPSQTTRSNRQAPGGAWPSTPRPMPMAHPFSGFDQTLKRAS